tara:strand:+ start:592 stop:726 length:135 start_codon:yes stop_codon:yes gene_type:complete
MNILLKETTLKVLRYIAPKLYNNRFDSDIVLGVVSDYVEGKQSS